MSDPGRPAPTPPPVLLPSGSVIVLTTAGVLICALGLRQFNDVLAPVLLALIFSIAVAPVRRRLKERGAPEWVATGAAVVAVYIVVVAFAWAAFALGTHFAAVMGSYAGQIEEQFQELADELARLGFDEDRLRAVADTVDVGKIVGAVVSLLGGLTGVLTNVFFIVVLLFFTVTDAGSFADNLDRIASRGGRIAQALQIFAKGTRSYLWVSTLFGAVVALIDVGVLMMLDVRDPWLWGLLAFMTNYIPNIGFLIGVIPPALIALVDQGLATALWVVAAYCVINFVLQTVVQPRVVGEAVGLSGTLSFLSLLVWSAILGGIGAIIAIPMSILVRAVFIDTDPQRAWLIPLLSPNDAKDATSPEEGDDARAASA